MPSRRVHNMTHYTAIPQAQALQQTQFFPFILDTQAHYFLSQSVINASRIENGKLLVRDKRAPKCLDQDYRAFLNFLPWLNHYRLALHGFQLNPYWNAMLDSAGFSHYSNLSFSLANADAIHEQFKFKFVKRRIALENSTFIAPITEQINIQKAVFKRCVDKHKQLNCLFLELPCIFTNPLQFHDEVKLPKIARKWLERLHKSEELTNKLYDVQWRIIKSLNGIYAIHAMIYVIGDEAQYSDFILQQWRRTCFKNGYELMQGSPYQILEKYCYFADSDMRSFWRLQIELCNEPFKIYRYASEHISYLWQTYTGNIPVKGK